MSRIEVIRMTLPNNIYDILKWVAMIVLPALATAVSTIFGLWDIPYSEPIAGTITAIATFMGAILMVSSANYKKQQTSE